MVMTGMCAWCSMKPLTLPRNVLRNLPCPLHPVTIMSAFNSLAIFNIPSPGELACVLFTTPFN